MDCEHSWVYHSDWEGDPSVPNGTRDCSFWTCSLCGDEVHEKPEDLEPDEPDYEKELDSFYTDTKDHP